MTSPATIFENILVDKDGPVGVITLNRPTVLNALNGKLLAELSLALVELEAIEFGTLVDTQDFREGTGAFLEKRKPEWKGK